MAGGAVRGAGGAATGAGGAARGAGGAGVGGAGEEGSSRCSGTGTARSRADTFFCGHSTCGRNIIHNESYRSTIKESVSSLGKDRFY